MTKQPLQKLTYDYVKQFLKPMEGRIITLNELRKELHIEKENEAFDDIRNILHYLSREKEPVISPSGKKDGVWKVIKRVSPVSVFGIERERRPVFDLRFPKDRDTDIEIPIADYAVIREGDLILVGGEKNSGKTTMSLNFTAENIEQSPILMGNEFTVLVGDEKQEAKNEPSPRFLNRLDTMKKWVNWYNGNGQDKFTLLPVREDFAEHIIPNRINIIDWINIETGEHYLIGTILEGIKKKLGRGIAIVILQKAHGKEAARGGQFTKDFADLEMLIDSHGETESRITVGTCKESTGSIFGRSWAFFSSNQGTEIHNIREVVRCWNCHGKGYTNHGDCPDCRRVGWIEKKGVKEGYEKDDIPF